MTRSESNAQNKSKKQVNRLLFTIAHKEFRPWVSVPVTVIVMVLLIALVYFCDIPNPNMILIAGLVICSSVFGFSGGIPATVIMLGYTMFFFSENNNFITFTGSNLTKVLVSLFGILANMLFVCMLKSQVIRALREIEELTVKYSIENEQLHTASSTDALTGVGNRTALRMNFEKYQKCELCALMMDIDDFKGINDNYGHEFGDKALALTGKMLADLFGAESCYRYGGDEFLVLIVDPFENCCVQRIESIIENRPTVDFEGRSVRINYSVGYRIAQTKSPEDFRRLLNDADAAMYEAKHSGKNRIVGMVYELK